MEYKDLLITPFWLILIYSGAYLIRPFVTDRFTRGYFIPGLTLKIAGALALGMIYQFYYGGGDTFTYYELGSKYIYQAFWDNPLKGIQLLLANGEYQSSTFDYASKIYTYKDTASYFVVRVAGFFDLFTFHTYSATACLFAVLTFSGLWAMFLAFYRFYPPLHFYLAIAIFFVPSVFFWGSGILKDPLTLGALGWATWAIVKIFFEQRKIFPASIILLLAFYTIYTIKIYIILCFVPAVILWLFMTHIHKIPNKPVRFMVAPLLLTIAAFAGYLAVQEIGEDNPRYSLDNITETAEATARWNSYVSKTRGGSVYQLGDDYDFSPMSILRKSPEAIWVTLYRPYIWESYNPVMLLAALESSALFVFTLFVFFRAGFFRALKIITNNPMVAFCFFFAITFSFAVGLSTYNFGSLVRYKIPMFPFFMTGLFVIYYEARLIRRKVKRGLKDNRK